MPADVQSAKEVLDTSKKLLEEARRLTLKAKSAESKDTQQQLARQAKALIEQSDRLSSVAQQLTKK